MRKWISVLLLSLAWVAGCGSQDNSAAVSGAAPVATVQTPVSAAAGGRLQSSTGHAVVIPPGGLSQDANLNLQVLEGPPQRPASQEFASSGQTLQLHLNGAQVTKPLQLEVPVPAELRGHPHLWVQWHVDNLIVPLPTQVDTTRNLAQGTLDLPSLRPRTLTGSSLPPVTSVIVGVGSSNLESRPPHVDWGTYNAYLLRTHDFIFHRFDKVVSLGQLTGSTPSLGNKPLLIVHGLGSSISSQEFVDLALDLRDKGGYTGIIGFEYDSLSDIGKNGGILNGAFNQEFKNWAPANATWTIVAHSMGTLVTRSAIEQNPALPIAATGNRAVLVCGPHLGSPIADFLVNGEPSSIQRVEEYLVLNDLMNFTNADGTGCQVNTTDPGFVDLTTASNNTFLPKLNQTAGTHPQFAYYTVAGAIRQLETSILDWMVGIYCDDGLVNIPSATFPNLQQKATADIQDDHFNAVRDEKNAFPTILEFATRPII